MNQQPPYRRHVDQTEAERNAEIDALANMQAATERRVDGMHDEMRRLVKEAVEEGLDSKLLSADERMWVRMAIKREAQSIAFRQAVIEKSITGLVWLAILGIGSILYEWLQAHGWKP